jgi:hypothetical protein
MQTDSLKVPKLKRKVSLWVHPEGQVIGSLFIREQSPHHAGEESPQEVLNEDTAFVVLEKQQPEQLRFYNRNAIIRVEYQGQAEAGTSSLACQLNMMDGSVIIGTICENLPPEHSRLFDYLNRDNKRFIRLFTSDNDVCLVNKSYIINVTTHEK